MNGGVLLGLERLVVLHHSGALVLGSRVYITRHTTERAVSKDGGKRWKVDPGLGQSRSERVTLMPLGTGSYSYCA